MRLFWPHSIEDVGEIPKMNSKHKLWQKPVLETLLLDSKCGKWICWTGLTQNLFSEFEAPMKFKMLDETSFFIVWFRLQLASSGFQLCLGRCEGRSESWCGNSGPSENVIHLLSEVFLSLQSGCKCIIQQRRNCEAKDQRFCFVQADKLCKHSKFQGIQFVAVKSSNADLYMVRTLYTIARFCSMWFLPGQQSCNGRKMSRSIGLFLRMEMWEETKTKWRCEQVFRPNGTPVSPY